MHPGTIPSNFAQGQRSGLMTIVPKARANVMNRFRKIAAIVIEFGRSWNHVQRHAPGKRRDRLLNRRQSEAGANLIGAAPKLPGSQMHCAADYAIQQPGIPMLGLWQS